MRYRRGKALAQIDGARRANSFNYYKQVVPTDPDPVQVLNTDNTQQTLEDLKQAGEGPAIAPVSVVVT